MPLMIVKKKYILHYVYGTSLSIGNSQKKSRFINQLFATIPCSSIQ